VVALELRPHLASADGDDASGKDQDCAEPEQREPCVASIASDVRARLVSIVAGDRVAAAGLAVVWPD
jgi:hypothetical protein